MSSGPPRRVSPKDIQVVQNLIERCLQLYMNRREVVETLLAQAKIEPGFTELVWQKLEEENREFFKAYYLRLMVKNQIVQFNKLLEQQVQLMQQMSSSIPPMPTSNGSHITTLHQNPACYTPEHMVPAMKPETLHHTIGSGLQNAFSNGGSSLHPSMHNAVDMSVHANRIDVAPNLIPAQSSNMGLIQGFNGGLIKSEAGYSGASQYMLSADGSVLEARPIVDTTVSSFNSVESSSQAMHEPLLDADISSLGQLGHFPRTFSLSDLTADFAQSSDILESYSRSPFLGAENENFLDSHERENQGDDSKRLDSISEGMSYDDFGSE